MSRPSPLYRSLPAARSALQPGPLPLVHPAGVRQPFRSLRSRLVGHAAANFTRPLVAIVALAAALLVVAPAGAIEPQVLPLWDNPAPLSNGQEDGDQPQLHVYLVPSDSPTPAIVVLPGGGYGNLAVDHEGVQIAKFFNDHGISVLVCHYRHRGKGNSGKGYGHPVPLMDAQRAIRTARGQAEQWNLDPNKIGIIGFSAGGHLASTVSTHFDSGTADAQDPIARVSSRPDFAILCYPVISLNQVHTHGGSRRNLLGDNPDPELLQSLSTENSVTAQTPPTFLFHTADDQAVHAENSLRYASALIRAGVPTELVIFQNGRHGLGLAQGHPGAQAWPQLCIDWLKHRQVLTPQ